MPELVQDWFVEVHMHMLLQQPLEYQEQEQHQ